jgi:hypothetical protein
MGRAVVMAGRGTLAGHDGAPALAQPPTTPILGVGFPYAPGLPRDLYAARDLLDFIELTPEELCRERRVGRATRLEFVPAAFDAAQAACAGRPIVVHGVELSIGSAHGWHAPCLGLLDELWVRWPFAWLSEHLSFQRALDTRGRSKETGVPLPLPRTRAALGVVAPRAAALGARYGVPFLLENPAHYLRELPAEPGLESEGAFMTALTQASGCGVLLDLHNLHCNAVNFGLDAHDELRRYPLERVLEIHVAGGSWRAGFLMDSHGARVPEPVWELLHEALAACPRVRGVVFEVLEVAARELSADDMARDLERLRMAWEARPGAVASALGVA